jgi:endonuclease/exonuclease/phosphatase (EEP) superfamily protein YafD
MSPRPESRWPAPTEEARRNGVRQVERASPPPSPSRLGVLLRRSLVALACVEAAGVVAFWVGLRFVGESWWVTTGLMYLPHVVLLAPVGAVALALAVVGPRRMLLVQAATAAVVLFPIMGLTLAGPRAPTPGAPRLRVLSFNVATGARSVAAVVAEIRAAAPDVILLQESTRAVNEAVAAAFPELARFGSTQFLVASRYPIVGSYEPPKLRFGGADRSPRFVGATLETPLGTLTVLNVHPISPRDALESVRGEGLVEGLRTGAVLDADGRVVDGNTALRRAQIEAIAAVAAASRHPVVIAGDTNLPGPSRMLAERLGRWQDGFAAVGRGFGYTFPVARRFPWMRIDRILAGPELRFLEFGVGESRASDHRCVWADVERPGAAGP